MMKKGKTYELELKIMWRQIKAMGEELIKEKKKKKKKNQNEKGIRQMWKRMRKMEVGTRRLKQEHEQETTKENEESGKPIANQTLNDVIIMFGPVPMRTEGRDWAMLMVKRLNACIPHGSPENKTIGQDNLVEMTNR